jgi:hypothetical protein
MSPIGGGEVTQGWAVNQGGYHLGRGGNLLEVGVVVSNWNGGDLSIHIKELVSIEISDARGGVS